MQKATAAWFLPACPPALSGFPPGRRSWCLLGAGGGAARKGTNRAGTPPGQRLRPGTMRTCPNPPEEAPGGALAHHRGSAGHRWTVGAARRCCSVKTAAWGWSSPMPGWSPGRHRPALLLSPLQNRPNGPARGAHWVPTAPGTTRHGAMVASWPTTYLRAGRAPAVATTPTPPPVLSRPLPSHLDSAQPSSSPPQSLPPATTPAPLAVRRTVASATLWSCNRTCSHRPPMSAAATMRQPPSPPTQTPSPLTQTHHCQSSSGPPPLPQLPVM